MLRQSRNGQGVNRTNSSMSRANHMAASQAAACCTGSAARLQLEIPSEDIKLETVLHQK